MMELLKELKRLDSRLDDAELGTIERSDLYVELVDLLPEIIKTMAELEAQLERVNTGKEQPT